MADIILDPSIRDWVVLPMVLIMVLIGATRHYVSLLLKSEKKMDPTQMQQMQTVSQAQRLRSSGKYISKSSFEMRKMYFVAREKDAGFKGVLRQKLKASNAANPMMDPSSMLDMMKGNMAFMVPNVVMMGLISYFFAGFVLVKVPFSLTLQFKAMLQRGIELNTLDVSYVSSLSWYFLVMFGMRGFLSLLLGEQSASDDAKAMQAQMGMGMGNNMAFDAAKAYKSERDSLLLHDHGSPMDHVELKLLGDKIPVSKPSIKAPEPKQVPSTGDAKRSKYSKKRR